MPPSHCYATSAPALSQTRASCAPCRSGKLPPAAPLLRVGSLLRLKAKNWERAVGAIFPKCLLNFAQPQADDVTNDATMCLFGSVVASFLGLVRQLKFSSAYSLRRVSGRSRPPTPKYIVFDSLVCQAFSYLLIPLFFCVHM